MARLPVNLNIESSAELFWWCRIRGTVIPTLWWKVALVCLYTFLIIFVHTFIVRLDFPQTLISILGTVVGLLLGFRTNSAYDRYWEGRKLWTQLIQEVRKLTRTIWSTVDENEPRSLLEKKSALNLLIAYVVAVKHYLREEYSDQYEDLKVLIGHLPRFTSKGISLAPNGSDPEKKQYERFKAFEESTPTNIPIEISYYILSYIKHVNATNAAPGWAITTMHNSLGNLVDALSNFERVLRTPIPMAYSIHLHISVWLYILSLPFQIVGNLGWMTLIVVGLGSFCLLGILSVAYEIENPFGYDENDLPLDSICEAIRTEVDIITGSQIPDAGSWIFDENNKPFHPASNLSTKSLSLKKRDDLLTLLAKGKAIHCDKGSTETLPGDCSKSKNE